MEPWQSSSSDTEKFHGNNHRSGESSFWTGVAPANFAGSPTTATSVMTLKNPIAVPNEGDPELSFWSFFQNESDDSAQVQVALTDGSTPPDQLQWDVVRTISDSTSTCVGTSPQGVVSDDFTNFRVNLGSYRGKQVLVRFVYILGPNDPALSQPCGWYVDDINVYTARWSPVADTTETNYTVLGRPNGVWAYRVLGVYNDGVKTAASNTEIANVTKSRNLPKKQLKRCMKFVGYHQLGTNGKDKFQGTEKVDVICTFGGADKANGKRADDVLLAGKGDDKISGNQNNDFLDGEWGNDRIKGGGGKDKLIGKQGNDQLSGGGGKDKCRAGPGTNRQRGC